VEDKLTEFIGFACYLAEKIAGPNTAVPDGVIQKALTICTKNLGVPIDGLEIALRPRGSTVLRRNPTIAAFSRPQELPNISSKYYSHDGMGYRATDYFRERLSTLARKTHFPEFEQVLRELLEIWVKQGGLTALVFVSLAASQDGGVSPLVADVEDMLQALREYVHHTYYLGRPTPASRRSGVAARIGYSQAALTDKLDSLRKGSVFRENLGKPFSETIGRRLEQSVVLFPEDCVLWEMVEFLAAAVRRFSDIVFAPADELPLFASPVEGQRDYLNDLAMVVTRLLSVTRSVIPDMSASTDAGRANRIAEVFFERVEQWLRAIVSKHDPVYFNSFERDDTVPPEYKTNVVFFDARDYTAIQHAVHKQQSSVAEEHFRNWLQLLKSVVTNWSIVFDGLASHNKGDSHIGYFDTCGPALDALAISLRHIEYLDDLQRGSATSGMRMKGGVGSSPAYHAAGQPHATAISDVSHAVEELANLSLPLKDGESVAFALSSFVEEHRQVADLVYPDPILFPSGKAWRVNHALIVEQLMIRIRAARVEFSVH
jgi:hypothetical protein